MDTSRLGRFRNDAPVEVASEPAPITHAEVNWQGRILVFDQALATTGWAHVAASASTGLAVLETGMIETLPTDATGYEDSFRRAELIFALALDLIRRVEPGLVVCEMPIAMGSTFKGKREGGLLACTAIRCATRFAGLPIRTYNAQRIKKRLTGNGNADKQEVRAAVIRTFGTLGSQGLRLNEHIYDAIALAMVAATEAT